jgi:subtilisin family serine protease
MARHSLRIFPVALFLFALILTGKLTAHSDSSTLHSGQHTNRGVFDASYRSNSPTHKVVIQANETALRDSILAEGGSIVEDYGAFVLMRAPAASADRVSVESTSGSSVRDDMNALLLRAGSFDTGEAEPLSANSLGEADAASEQLYLVQFVGPVKNQWVSELKSSAEIVSYIPNNAYLVRANADGLASINSLAAKGTFVQWTGAFKPSYKIAPEIPLGSDEEIAVTVQFASTDAARDVQDLVARSSASVIGTPTSILNYTNIRIRVHSRSLADVARMSNVLWIEPWTEPVLNDEKQGLILAGKLTGSEPASSYLAWLQSKGIASSPDFTVDVADTGIDQGQLDPQVLHQDFLNAAGAARVMYARNVVDQEIVPQDTQGHGTINASIVGGYNVGTVFPFVDPNGYRYGLGTHPYVKLGVTQIFAPDFTNPSFPSMVSMMYRDGARISNNSWGSYNNTYTTDCQTYDSLVRDAQSTVQGNQEMTVVFSSGNKGPGGQLTSPGNAKNVIMVGASENLRAGLDGCQIDSSGADDIMSLISFSSGGPTTDGRTRPDIVAPGTHIQGARSQSRSYNAGGVCGPGNYPLGQSLYTWSSGTSHAAPAVSGGAAIVRQLFQQATGKPPSPAMVKAYLTNSTSYMTGLMAGDSLPGANQGWGLMSLGRALDDVPRILVDQDQVLANTGQVFTVQGRIADPSKPLRITLAWTDAPGNPLASPVVNDLDLQVDVGGKTYLGNHFSGAVSVEGGSADRHNNLEAVWAPLGVSGNFTIRVVGANIAGDGVPGNADLTDQDFALVVYNVESPGGGLVDSPPSVSLTTPAGGEHFLVGSTIRIQWTASDDKGIQSQRVEFSPDGVSFSPIALLDGNARTYDWRVPGWPTTTARIRITALDGVNLPSSSMNSTPFEIVSGPPDTTPPTVTLLSHNGTDPVGGGLTSSIKWREADNVGVLRRVVEISSDNGNTYQKIADLTAPSIGDTQSYDWQVPVDMDSQKAKVRITVYDGAGNSAAAASKNNFDIWAMPIVNGVTYNEGDKPEFELAGRNFRVSETEIWVDDMPLKKIQYADKFFTGNGTYKHVSSFDKKLNKRVPDRTWVKVFVKLPRTGQVSPAFDFRRKRPSS